MVKSSCLNAINAIEDARVPSTWLYDATGAEISWILQVYREILRELCPHPFDRFKNIPDAELQNRMNFYYENFQKVKEYVGKNKKFPEFKED